MLRVVDRIAECDDGRHQEVLPEARTHIALHRFGGPTLPYVHDAAGIARFYRAHPSYTGGQMPYSVVIYQTREYGPIMVEQALPISEVGPHALRWSDEAIGVAVLGDFRKAKPSFELWNVTVDICAALAFWVNDNVSEILRGHSELPHGSSDPDKDCPGELGFPMDKMRVVVTNKVRWLETKWGTPNLDLKRELQLLVMGFEI